MTQREKMLSGKIYDTSDSELVRLRARANKLCVSYNKTHTAQVKKRERIIKKLLPAIGKDSYVQGPVFFDYGVFTSIGERCFINYNWTVLDCAPVTLGNDVFIGPNCTLAPPVHPLLSEERKLQYKADGTAFDEEYAKPLVIENGVWLATNVTVCGGVTIGENSVIGAGSVVTRDIPANVFAAGNPCRVIRPLTQEDCIHLKKELW